LSEIIKAAIGVVATIFIIAVGVILLTALYPINPFIAILGILLLVAVAFAMLSVLSKTKLSEFQLFSYN